MGSGMVAHGFSADATDLEGRRLAGFEIAVDNAADVQDTFAKFLRIIDLKPAGGCGDDSSVANLAALLGVEIGAIQQEGNVVVFPEPARNHDGILPHPTE